MTGRSFRYPDEQWRKMEAIVERAGGAVARDKFNAQRAAFEKTAGGWNGRIANWKGRNFGHDETGRYKRIEGAAHEFRAALDEQNFPAIFIGNELVWKALADTRENKVRFAAFRMAIDHVGARAARMAKPRRKQDRLARDMFFAELGRVWRVELGLAISASVKSHFVAFIEAASDGVDEAQTRSATRNAIAEVVRKWPRRARRGWENGDEEN